MRFPSLLLILFACGSTAELVDLPPAPAESVPVFEPASPDLIVNRVVEVPLKNEELKGLAQGGVLGELIGGTGTQGGMGGLGSRGVGSGGGGGYGAGVSGVLGFGKGGRVEASAREQYTDHGTNGHVLTAADTLSTFSIDVDTASYAIARRHLREGHLPPAASVRVEEFVNAQRYHYASPDGEGPIAANMELAPDPFRPGHHLLRVGVKAAEPDEDRDPVHLTFLVDVSGSMNRPGKLHLAQRALIYLVEHLQPTDRVSLVTYAGGTRLVLPSTPVEELDRIRGAIAELRTGGGTRMNDGMELAYQQALANKVVGENRVIVLSDGDANIGPASHEGILRSLKKYAQQGVTLSTVGFGRGNYKDTLMEQLADNGDGMYAYIDSFAEAKKVFGTDLAGAVQTVARDVKLQLEFDSDSVLSYRLIGYENRDIADRDFRNDAVDAGEIGSGHAVTALYELVLRDHPSATLATLRIRSKPPGVDAPAVERRIPLPTSSVRAGFAVASPDFRVAVATATFAELLRRSPHAEEVSYDQLARIVRSADRAEDEELVALMELAGRL